MKLKKCPHCKGKKTQMKERLGRYSEEKYVECSTCRARGEPCRTEKQATKAWNTRAILRECKSFKEYKAIKKPTCGCESCLEKWNNKPTLSVERIEEIIEGHIRDWLKENFVGGILASCPKEIAKAIHKELV